MVGRLYGQHSNLNSLCNMWALLSIPHTGTHFVNSLLGGGNQLTLNEDEHGIYTSHIYRMAIFEKVSQAGMKIVAPMRHPLTTAESWCKWAAAHPENYNDELVNPSVVPSLYKKMIMGSQLYDVDFIPIDSPYREEHLRRFNRKHGLDITTQWKPLNSIGDVTASMPAGLAENIAQLMSSNRDFFEKFYQY